jgi:flagellar biosynthesis protein FliQ
MTPEFIVTIGRDMILMVLKVAAPMLVCGLVVGLVFSVLMSATQIQEMTLTFVPKIVAVLLSLIFFAPWLLRILTEYTVNLLNNIPFYIK